MFEKLAFLSPAKHPIRSCSFLRTAFWVATHLWQDISAKCWWFVKRNSIRVEHHSYIVFIVHFLPYKGFWTRILILHLKCGFHFCFLSCIFECTLIPHLFSVNFFVDKVTDKWSKMFLCFLSSFKSLFLGWSQLVHLSTEGSSGYKEKYFSQVLHILWLLCAWIVYTF